MGIFNIWQCITAEIFLSVKSDGRAEEENKSSEISAYIDIFGTASYTSPLHLYADQRKGKRTKMVLVYTYSAGQGSSLVMLSLPPSKIIFKYKILNCDYFYDFY